MFPVRWLKTAASAILLLLLSFAAEAQTRDRITVLAAASLTDVMQQIGKDYQAATGKWAEFSFAGSMTLAKQIEASAGADMFISADSESMDYLDRKNLIARTTRTNLLANSLVLIAPAGSKTTLRIAPGFKLADALMGGRLALADIASVPAGRYGKAALTTLGVWDSVKDHLAQGEDVRATLAYVARGEAPLGIVYATDARVEPKVRVAGTFPENTHEPIVYPVALTKDAKPDAATFLAYLKSGKARPVLERAGFRVLTGK
ncbi:MAG TPA: molybdate ABC transporter substrate-binding protein [Micropepsaceae bacterium]|jgi:molybdate transport system substrate-binding protein